MSSPPSVSKLLHLAKAIGSMTPSCPILASLYSKELNQQLTRVLHVSSASIALVSHRSDRSGQIFQWIHEILMIMTMICAWHGYGILSPTPACYQIAITSNSSSESPDRTTEHVGHEESQISRDCRSYHVHMLFGLESKEQNLKVHLVS